MKQEHMDALAKYGKSLHLNHNGVDLWSDGNILITGKVADSKELDSIAKAWDGVVNRPDEITLPQLGPIYKDDRGYSREIRSQDGKLVVVISETYRRLLAEDGSGALGIHPEKSIAFRKDGVLTAICMPMRVQYGEELTDHEPTESELFESFANPDNDWYLQGSIALRKELRKIKQEIETLEEVIADREQELTSAQSQAAGLRKRIKAHKDELVLKEKQNGVGV